jgi:hypothetical protein
VGLELILDMLESTAEDASLAVLGVGGKEEERLEEEEVRGGVTSLLL